MSVFRRLFPKKSNLTIEDCLILRGNNKIVILNNGKVTKVTKE